MSTDGQPFVLPTGDALVAAGVAKFRETFAGTRGVLRAGLVGCLVALAVFALVATSGMSARRNALQDARAAAAQVVLVQRVRTSLVEADALATNAFLVGGLEPAEQRARYEAGVATAAATLADASGRGADSTGLATANTALARYTGLVESARANNRQGFPVGVAYLKQASALLRDEILPALDEVSSESADDVDRAYDHSRDARYAIWLGVLVLIVVFGITQWRMSVLTKRTLNVGAVAASACALIASLVAVVTMTSAASQASDVRDGPYREARAIAQARINAFAAKSAESLTLISRGSGAAFEEEWQREFAAAAAALAGTQSGPALSAALGTYADVHVAIRDLDDGGDWDGAVGLATGFGDGSSNAEFGEFDESSSSQLDRFSAQIDGDLADAARGGTARVFVFLLAALGAVLVTWGLGQRLREYR